MQIRPAALHVLLVGASLASGSMCATAGMRRVSDERIEAADGRRPMERLWAFMWFMSPHRGHFIYRS